MKSIIFVFALIVAASCDVSEIVSGDGWFKDESGYHYTVPETRFLEEAPEEPATAPVEEPVIVELPVAEEPAPVFVPEEAAPGCPNGGSGPFCCINGADNESCILPGQEQIVEVIEYIDVPVNDLREYLPPKSLDAKKKRQAPVRRQVRKVYRRFVRKH